MFYRNRKTLPIYDTIWLDIVISDDTEKLNEEFKDEGTQDEWFACVFKRSFKFKEEDERWRKSIVVVLNPNLPGSKMTPSIMLHEAIHIKNKVFQHYGIKNSYTNDEPEAYFTEFLFNKINKFYKKVLKEEKKLTLKTEQNGTESELGPTLNPQ